MDRCLDDNEVQAFFRGSLSRSQTAEIQAHVDRCSLCRHLVAEVAKSSSENPALEKTEIGVAPAASPRVVIRPPKQAERRVLTQPLAAGDVVAERWRLVRVLGEGGVGVVWEAAHTVMQRRVALKMLKSAESDASRRFFREARVTAALRHPHIVEVHDVFVLPETGTPAMVMEYLEGMPLASLLRRTPREPLALAGTARALVQVVSAVAAAHEVGVVHRDLKPENVFLVGAAPTLDDPVVKVLDFGLAKLTATEGAVASTGQLTKRGLVLGTPHYMAPEQVGVDHEIDPRTDVWALGVILYECLAGARPIEGRTVTELFRAIADAKVTPLAKRAPKLPRPITKLVGRMLSKKKSDRPNLEEVHEVLADYV